ncbi:MAG: M16 family metallopeptidase [Planctomycetota bacterium]|jgi:predicted Zn-dependent peptidase
MRKFLLAAVGIVLLFCTASIPDDDTLNIDVKEKILDNGLQVLVVERPGAPEVVCRLFFKVGSVNEVPGITGISHLCEHLMFKGTKVIGTKDPVKDAEFNKRINEIVLEMRKLGKDMDASSDKLKSLQAELDELKAAQKEITVSEEIWQHYRRNGGTGMNAFTSNDYTGYVVTVPSNKLELYFWMESDRLANPVFREFYSELDVIKEERRLRENSPMGRFWQTFSAVMYDAHPYSHPVIGWMVDLDHMTLEKVKKYHGTYYVPNNAVMALVGDLKAEDAFKLVEKYFGRIPRGEDPPPVVTLEHEQRFEKRLYGEIDSQPQAIISYHTPAITHDDSYPLRVLETVLSGKSGALNKKIVREKELATSCSCSIDVSKFPGSFTFEGTAKGRHTPEQVEQALYEIIEGIKKKPVLEKDLKRAKKQMRARMIRMLGSNGGLAYMLAGASCMYDWRELLKVPARIEKVSDDDIMRVAKKYFVKTNRTVGIVTQPKKESGPYLTILMGTMPRTPQMEVQIGMIKRALANQIPDANVRMDEENIYLEVGRFGLKERDKAKERLEELLELIESSGMMLEAEPEIVEVGLPEKEGKGK